MPDRRSKTITLERIASLPFGVFGKIDLEGRTLYTVEREWRNNERMVSCIPNGVYTCERAFFNRGGYPTFEITHVPLRTSILFHVANFPHELNGCIGLGDSIGVIQSLGGPKLGVRNSRLTFDWFYDLMLPLTPFELIARTFTEDF